MVNKWLYYIQSWLFGSQCQLCFSTYCQSKSQLDICSDCYEDLPANLHACRSCSLPLPSSAENAICGKCQKNPPAFDSSIIPFVYRAPFRQLISKMKFHHDLVATAIIAELFIKATEKVSSDAECIIPVPLHPSRLRQRGYNQAIELARQLTKTRPLKIEHSLCQRNFKTESQSGLSAKQRKTNLKNAFRVTREHHYKHVIILDDVVTTGSTVNELARVLKQSGVEKIEVWAIARAC